MKIGKTCSVHYEILKSMHNNKIKLMLSKKGKKLKNFQKTSNFRNNFYNKTFGM